MICAKSGLCIVPPLTFYLKCFFLIRWSCSHDDGFFLLCHVGLLQVIKCECLVLSLTWCTNRTVFQVGQGAIRLSVCFRSIGAQNLKLDSWTGADQLRNAGHIAQTTLQFRFLTVKSFLQAPCFSAKSD